MEEYVWGRKRSRIDRPNVPEEKKDLSQGRSFSRIMQQAINGTEGEVVVESSYQGTYS